MLQTQNEFDLFFQQWFFDTIDWIIAAIAAAPSAAACFCPLRSNFLGYAQIRLSGGRTRYEGRLEVLSSHPNGTQRWGLICGETWSTREAMVACRQLGLGYANQGVQVSLPGLTSPLCGCCHIIMYRHRQCRRCNCHILCTRVQIHLRYYK